MTKTEGQMSKSTQEAQEPTDSRGNPMAQAKLVKVVLNMSLGKFKEDQKQLEEAQRELTLIAGQKAVLTKARKAIAAFGVREGNVVGARVTLRAAKMHDFVNKLFKVAMPRTRDFRGLPARGFDGQGNYTMGLEEQGVFLEIDPNKTSRTRSLQVTFATTATTNPEARQLLTELGLPLEKDK